MSAENSSPEEAVSGPPPVVALMVTSNPGPWFTESLQAMAAQDYANLAILIIDAASAQNPLPLIAEILPGAYVRRLEDNPGYSTATNRALSVVEGASYLLLCHDDVAPSPNAVRAMIETALRENAGIVVPKLVDWDNPSLLQDLGGTIDGTGVYLPSIERGDLDQGQHDTGSEIVIARGGCMLVRADLFETLGGLDAEMRVYGEDIDLSWRAQLAGARIVTAPAARVRHREALSSGLRTVASEDESEETEDFVTDDMILVRRHRLRSVLKLRQRRRLPFVVVQMFFLAMLELIYSIVLGRGPQASAIVAAWTWNFSHPRSLLSARRRTQRVRTVSDKVLLTKFASTKERVSATIRSEWEERSERMAQEMRGRELVGSLRNLPAMVWAAVIILWLIGSRHLLSSPLPAVGRMMPLPHSPFTLLHRFSGALPGAGFGTVAPDSPADLIVGLLGIVFLGAMGVLWKVLVLGMIPLGVWGMSRATRPLKTPRARLLAVIAYAMVPLPYDSLALGRWDGLVAYAVAPFLLARMLRAYGSLPYQAPRSFLRLNYRRAKHFDLKRIGAKRMDEDVQTLALSELSPETAAALLSRSNSELEVTTAEAPHDQPRRDRLWFLMARRVFPLALLLGSAGVFAPQLMPATVLLAVALIVGSFLSGEAEADHLRTLAISLAACVFAILLALPAIVGSDDGWHSLWWHMQSLQEPHSLSVLFRFGTGGFQSQLATFGLLIAALPALLMGREWRFHLSLRLWLVTVAMVLVTWIGQRGWIGQIKPDPHVFLALAGAAVALNIAVGVVALYEDLSSYRFGWRQLMPVFALVGVLFAVFPIASRTGNGSWFLPSTTHQQLLSWISDQRSQGSFRVLWMGDSDVMPGGARKLSSDVGGAVITNNATPTGPALPAIGGDGEALLANDVSMARSGNTVQLGRLLAPYAVRYIVVPNRTGASASGGINIPVPSQLEPTLAAQLDLRNIDSDSSLVVYENMEWAAISHIQSPPAVVASHDGDTFAAQAVSMAGSPAVLQTKQSPASFTGTIPAGDVYIAQTFSKQWQLTVNRQRLPAQLGFGWASTYVAPNDGSAQLRYVAPLWVSSMQISVTLLWVLLFLVSVRYRANRGRFS